MSQPSTRICIVPRTSGVGGMVSFQNKLEKELARYGIAVTHDLTARPYAAVLVIGGTRQLAGLWRARRQGVRVVQRLDGMNWLHRLKLRQRGLVSLDFRHFIRSEYGNFILSFFRSRLASRIVYQSEFSRRWWERTHGVSAIPSQVIYNGVDLNVYSPVGADARPNDCYRLLVVEGSWMGGYDQGLQVAVGWAEQVQRTLTQAPLKKLELSVVGRVPPELQHAWDQKADVSIRWVGLVPGERIPHIDRTAHLYYSADVNSACPNAVIEALACGLPVVSFDTGALPELVTGDAGRIVPYGGNPWHLDPPDVIALGHASVEILYEQERFRAAARCRAEAAFSLERMVEAYLQALLG